MGNRTTTCDHERLRLLLSGELPLEMESDATDHVAHCQTCRRELENLAGERDWWNEVETSLRKNSDLLQQADRSPHAGGSPAASSPPAAHPREAGDERSFAADFAVDFLEPGDQPDVLGRLDEIEILEVIGIGGMGIVLKGYQRDLGRFVAVKVMAPHLASSGPSRKRFAREARAAAAIVHPHVMAIHSVNASGRLPYLVMPFVDCESLQQRIDRNGPLKIEEVLRIGHQIALGLSAAHAQGLVHRDVKPANILLEKGVDRVMLTDFGLARAADDASLTRTGVIAGTPQYMSPEQARGDAIDARSDLFSLGSVMYAMCTGRPPFRAETSYGILRRITDDEPRAIRETSPELPSWLTTLVTRLHAKAPEYRFDSAGQVALLFEQCLAHVQTPDSPLPPELQEHRVAFRLSGRILTIVASALGVAAIAIAASLIWMNREGKPEASADHEKQAVKPVQPVEPPMGDPATDWDATAIQIERLSEDLDSLQSQADRRWDDPASTTDPSSLSNPNIHSNKEALP